METITFHVSSEDKGRLFGEAKKARLSLSSYCRLKVLEGSLQIGGQAA